MNIKCSWFKEDPSSDEEYEEPIILLSIWKINYDVMNEEDDEEEWSRSLPMKQIKDKYSVVISWYCFVFSWCVMHDRMFALMTVCMWVAHGVIHLSIATYLEWNLLPNILY